jgi:tetratricopeptide (TPR) repeat protein
MQDMSDPNVAKTRGRARLWIAAAFIPAIGALVVWGAWKREGVDPDQVRQEAESDVQSGRYERAAALLGTLRTPTSRDYLLKAQVAKGLSHAGEALADLAEIPDTDPVAAQARLLAGQIELRRDRIRFAEQALLAALKLDPTLVQAHRELLYIYATLLRRRELNEHFQALERLTPMTFDNVFHWCLTRNTVWEPHDRMMDLTKFVAADPEDRWSRVALAEVLRQVGRREEAANLLAVLPESDPDARAVRARLALDRGDDRAVESILAEGAADHPELARLRGWFALAHGNGPAAVRHFRAAFAAEPDDSNTVFGLGTALALAGDRVGAEPFLRESKAFDTLGALLTRAANPANHQDTALMRALGAACEAVHRRPEARAWFNLALQTNPLDEEAQKALYRFRKKDGG